MKKLFENINRLIRKMLGCEIEAKDVEWVTNRYCELGVRINGRSFFLYKGDSLEYKNGLTDEDGLPVNIRKVGKREFGETCNLPLL